jgi:hypothetical protein
MIVFFILMPITIIGILLYLSYLTFQLLVEVVKLKKLRKDIESEKRFPAIKRKVKKFILKKIKKGRFSSLINSKG